MGHGVRSELAPLGIAGRDQHGILLCCLIHLRYGDSEAAALFTSTSRFDRRIQGKEISLESDFVRADPTISPFFSACRRGATAS